MHVTEARREFPGLANKAFLDAACVSLAPKCATVAVAQFLDMALKCDAPSSSAHHVAMDELRRAAVPEAARLLRVSPEEVALVESTTHGLNIAATSLPLPPGSNVVISDLEFLQVAMPWAVRSDIELRAVPNRGGRVEVDDVVAAMDGRTRMVVMSSVQWSNGFRVDLKALGAVTRQRSIPLVVDSIQQLGAIDLDVQECNIDIMTAGGHKWLNSPFGCGILYVRKDLIPTMQPAFWGYLNLTTPEQGWPNYFGTPTISPVREYRVVETAQKFEIGGTANYPGAIGLAASLRLVNAIGIKAIEAHVLSLTDYLMEQLPAAGATVITVPDWQHRSGIVTFRFYKELAEEQRLLEQLHRWGVYVAMRFTSGIGGIRVSCHYFNNREDIDRLIVALLRAGAEKAPDYAR